MASRFADTEEGTKTMTDASGEADEGTEASADASVGTEDSSAEIDAKADAETAAETMLPGGGVAHEMQEDYHSGHDAYDLAEGQGTPEEQHELEMRLEAELLLHAAEDAAE